MWMQATRVDLTFDLNLRPCYPKMIWAYPLSRVYIFMKLESDQMKITAVTPESKGIFLCSQCVSRKYESGQKKLIQGYADTGNLLYVDLDLDVDHSDLAYGDTPSSLGVPLYTRFGHPKSYSLGDIIWTKWVDFYL